MKYSYQIQLVNSKCLQQISGYYKKIAKSIRFSGRFISPYFFAIIIFTIMYVRLCSDDSHLEGNKLYEKGEYALALKEYNDYLMLYPNDIKTLYNHGRCLEFLGKNDEAAQDFEQVLQKDPDNVKAMLSMSQYHYRNEEYKSALLYCTYAAQLEKENVLAHYYKARTHHKLGQFTDALNEYGRVLSLDPEFGFAYFQRSSLLFSVGLRKMGCYDLRMADSLRVNGASEALQKYCR